MTVDSIRVPGATSSSMLQPMPSGSLEVLKNKEFIAISQDSLGEAVRYLPDLSTDRSTQVWAGPLTGGRVLILVLSEMTDVTTVKVTLSSVLGLSSDRSYAVRDIWGAKSLGRVKGNLSLEVATHQTRALVLS
ncbi:Alpha-galactosidase alpha-n-acetylgalactosaminidase [Penicillium odoratum]|uniref:Alpha-galactosidase alpha-n-acetylgalactosaminidase n=1 Tax=Penicillium odoratum TaxID=1167516 RepID=UPI002547E1F2|nr:Alpha-galactosidase alpha-n-acetylgalactosaminidase [Penicillium odoratum]KAJ5777421.1 Alpha-galactosidase alpha-n-acetylgalactosaminidase [Penicillium odoratum]